MGLNRSSHRARHKAIKASRHRSSAFGLCRGKTLRQYRGPCIHAFLSLCKSSILQLRSKICSRIEFFFDVLLINLETYTLSTSVRNINLKIFVWEVRTEQGTREN